MRETVKKYFNMYLVFGLISAFSFLYMLSFAFVIADVNKGSSLQMKKDMLEKQKKSK